MSQVEYYRRFANWFDFIRSPSVDPRDLDACEDSYYSWMVENKFYDPNS